jgi:hypothetical protein
MITDTHLEYIVCSAVWFKINEEYKHQPINITYGLVVTGLRHSNCFSTVYQLLQGQGIRHSNGTLVDHEQGFLTSKNRFLNRIDSAQIAFKQGQISKEVDELLSEHLY